MNTRIGITKFFVCAGISFGGALLVGSGMITIVRAAGEPAKPAQTVQSNATPLHSGIGNAGSSGSNPENQPPHETNVQDPGVRVDAPGSGNPLSSLSAAEVQFFQDGLNRFLEVDSVTGSMAGEPGFGLGPSFNSNSCASCHAQPAIGGTSPSANPQLAVAADAGATNSIPNFLTASGPVVEVRFPFQVNSNGNVTRTADGGVHALFTITGRSDAPGCVMAQPNFSQMQQLNNIVFRIPTPVFGAGLIENISDNTIYTNMNANSGLKQALGISGHPNISGNDGTITRFGWKAQNKSLEVFAGEAYNVEIGVTNELFPEERSRPPAACTNNPTPEDTTNYPASGAAINSDTVAFATFMRFLAPPEPSSQGIPSNPSPRSIANGESLFGKVHCDTCHTTSLQTSNSHFTAGLSNQKAALYSDLLVHHMGTGLADNIAQGTAGPDEFRTAPLWGLGQRIFFLHDGRATPSNGGLVTAIQAHSSPGSEANTVLNLFQRLSDEQKQDLLNFLRSL